MGRRVKKTVYAYSSGAWDDGTSTLFVYDGWNLIEELDAEENVQKSDVWGLDWSQSLQEAGGVGGLIAAVDGAVTYLYSYDVNGNVGQVVDSADGSVGAHYEYDPYGDLINHSGAYADENVYRFSTKYYDTEVSLYYYGYRYYSPKLGRWNNRDPFAEKGGINQYIFVRNSPINKNDILGLTWSDYWMKKKYKIQIPKAQGISYGGLLELKSHKLFDKLIGLTFNGAAGGLQEGIYFFPDSCEIAAYTIKAGIVRDLHNQEPIFEFDKFEQPIMGMFMNPYDDELNEKIKKDLTPHDEEGIYMGYGLSVEYAIYIGNPIQGKANARSFEGIFKTIQVGILDKGGSIYAGTNEISNGNWAGFTYDVVGPGIGAAKVNWDYQISGRIVKLEEYKGGECLCNFLTIFYVK